MIYCVGVGPGDKKHITNYAIELISNADVVVGFEYVLKIIDTYLKSSTKTYVLTYKNQVSKLEEIARLHHQGLNVIVAFMGDIHFSGFQLFERVELACGHNVETVPGISSSQILASRARVCFDETSFITFHRRGNIEPFKKHLISSLNDQRNVIIIPRPFDFMPNDIAHFLLDNGIDTTHQVEVWENLTQAESCWTGFLKDLNQDFSDISIMLIRCLVPLTSQL